jgi:hypothetical protein
MGRNMIFSIRFQPYLSFLLDAHVVDSSSPIDPWSSLSTHRPLSIARSSSSTHRSLLMAHVIDSLSLINILELIVDVTIVHRRHHLVVVLGLRSLAIVRGFVLTTREISKSNSSEINRGLEKPLMIYRLLVVPFVVGAKLGCSLGQVK